MVYVTGDTHGSFDFKKLEIFAEAHPELTKNDYVIIVGDFGVVWSAKHLEEDLKLYCDLPFTVLFIDGNHENFDLLNAYPVQEWNGGKVHFVKPDIIHLMRGQVFTIEGKTFFTFGGATSIDKAYRTEGLSWWQAEEPSQEDMNEALKNLEKHDFKVNYILTHTCDTEPLYRPPIKTPFSYVKCYHENAMLSEFEQRVEYDCWFFGHFHMDADITYKKTLLYNNILRLI